MKNKKTLLIICLICAILGTLLIISGIIINNKSLENMPEIEEKLDFQDEIINSDETVKIDVKKEFKNLEVSNFVLEKISNKECKITAIVKNNSSENFNAQVVKLKLYDKEKNLQKVLGASLGNINSGEEQELVTVVALEASDNIENIAAIELEEN